MEKEVEKTNSRKLIHFNQPEYLRQKEIFEANLKTLNQIVDEFGKLGAGKITLNQVSEILSGEFQSIEDEVFRVVARSQKTKIMVDVALDQAEIRLKEFEEEAVKLTREFNRRQRIDKAWGVLTPLSFYLLTPEGQFILPEESLTIIRDQYCSNFIETPEEQKLYDILQKIADLNNEFYDHLGKIAKSNFDQSYCLRHVYISEFLASDGNNQTIIDQTTDFKTLAR